MLETKLETIPKSHEGLLIFLNATFFHRSKVMKILFNHFLKKLRFSFSITETSDLVHYLKVFSEKFV